MTAKTPRTLKFYSVRLTFRFPAWDEKDGLVLTLRGYSKADATKSARRQWADAGHQSFTTVATEITREEYDEYACRNVASEDRGW